VLDAPLLAALGAIQSTYTFCRSSNKKARRNRGVNRGSYKVQDATDGSSIAIEDYVMYVIDRVLKNFASTSSASHWVDEPGSNKKYHHRWYFFA
jgi:hypothetical protein